MASRKSRNIYFPKYFMAVRNNCINILVLHYNQRYVSVNGPPFSLGIYISAAPPLETFRHLYNIKKIG